MFKRSIALGTAAALAIIAAAAPASADDLLEAIALAYRTNPTLLAQRANQRALDETYVQARSALRPTLGITGSAGYTYNNGPATPGTEIDTDGDGVPDMTIGGSSGNSESNSGSVGLSLSQDLYTGGRITYGITQAEAAVLRGRENLRDIEQQVLTAVIAAYADVLRDLEILRIREENLGVLNRQLEEANARFEVGEITRTDVAQSEARLAQSESDLAVAQAQLSVSRANYASVVGQSPGTLEALPPLPGVPTDFDVALDVGIAENPTLLAAEYQLASAEAGVAEAKAAYRPSARLSASYGGSDDLRDFDPFDRTSLTATASISFPLFTGGLNASRVAQALEQANAAQISVEGARREVLRDISNAYAQMVSANSTVTANIEAVNAARIAAEGVRQEAQVGLRTTLDVLNQELELRAAEVTLASARRNEYVAQATLLAAMGRLGGEDLVTGIEVYDPADNFDEVKDRGALPWDGVIEAIDRIAAPAIVPANDAEDAPIDAQLKAEAADAEPVAEPQE